MTVIAFIGLGVMGKPMAKNLLAAGHDLVVHSRSPGPVGELVAAGAAAASSPAEAVADAGCVITMLPDSPDVESVMLGEGGVLDSVAAETLIIDMSTIRPETSRKIAERAEVVGAYCLDAPVSGGEKGAIDGTLSVMVGGYEVTFERARPILEVVGETVVHVGPAGAGQTVKAANQILVGGTLALLAEAVVLLASHGLEAERAFEVLAGGMAGSRVLDMKAATMLAGEFQPGFRSSLHHKDLQIALDAATDARVTVPMTSTVAQLFAALRATGRGDLDHSAVVTIIEDLSGVSNRVR